MLRRLVSSTTHGSGAHTSKCRGGQAELTDYRQRLKDRTGAEHENQRLHLDTEKALRELMVLGTTLNLFECEVIYTINWEQLDRLTQVTEASVPLIQQFKATHRQAEKPVAQAA